MGGNCPRASSPGGKCSDTIISQCIFTLDSNEAVSLSVHGKENFGFQKLKILFSEILFQKKPLNMSQILMFYLSNREKLFSKMKSAYCSEV